MPTMDSGANKNRVLAPGNAWTGRHLWTEGSDPSSAHMQKLLDIKNTAIDIHGYPNVDFPVAI